LCCLAHCSTAADSCIQTNTIIAMLAGGWLASWQQNSRATAAEQGTLRRNLILQHMLQQLAIRIRMVGMLLRFPTLAAEQLGR
jgi:hypothetical protein